MKVKVLKTYNDLILNRLVMKNATMSVSKERAKELEGFGFVKIIAEEDRDKIAEEILKQDEIEIKIPDKETKVVKKKKKK